MAERGKKATIVYLNGDGAETKLTAGDVAAIFFKFADGDDRTVALNDLDNYVRGVATVRGIAEKIRDTYADTDSVEEAKEEADTAIEFLLAGEWSAERKAAGPKLSWFIEAVKEVKVATARERGITYDPAADETDLRARYVGKDKSAVRTKALEGNASLRAAYERMLARAAQEKAAKATARAEASAAKATGATGGDGMAL